MKVSPAELLFSFFTLSRLCHTSACGFFSAQRPFFSTLGLGIHDGFKHLQLVSFFVFLGETLKEKQAPRNASKSSSSTNRLRDFKETVSNMIHSRPSLASQTTLGPPCAGKGGEQTDKNLLGASPLHSRDWEAESTSSASQNPVLLANTIQHGDPNQSLWILTVFSVRTKGSTVAIPSLACFLKIQVRR